MRRLWRWAGQRTLLERLLAAIFLAIVMLAVSVGFALRGQKHILDHAACVDTITSTYLAEEGKLFSYALDHPGADIPERRSDPFDAAVFDLIHLDRECPP